MAFTTYNRPSPMSACTLNTWQTHMQPQPPSKTLSPGQRRGWRNIGDVQTPSCHLSSDMIKGFVKRSSHVPRRAAPLAPHHIRIICDMLDASPSASSGIKPAILIGYACFLRSSNILSPSIQVWGGPHTLLAYHIKTDDQGLRIYINSTKTCPSGTGPIFVIPYSSPRRYCPVSAWIAYKETVNPWPLGPAFVHRSGIPITPREVVGCMRIALQQQPDILPSQVTMHSLRRGATYAAVDQGLPIDTIKARGTWKSDSGVAPYLPVSKKVQTLRVHTMAN